MALDDFIVNSDYPMDIVVFSAEGTVPANGSTSISHNLGFAPLPFGVWSGDNGTSWQPITAYNISGGTLVEMKATSSAIIISTSLATSVVQFRIFCLQPASVTAETTPPNVVFSNYVLNSDFNYSKLVASTVWEVSEASQRVLVQHNLGYIPEVMVWAETPTGEIISFVNGYYYISPSGIEIVNIFADNSAVYATATENISTAYSKLHVRVYGGKNG